MPYFSHNGTAPSHPEEFVDLESFGQNNYTKQLEDLSLVLTWVCDPYSIYHSSMDAANITLIGHSLGGGIAILYAAKDPRIRQLITWASISECKTPWGGWSPEKMREWQDTGVQFYPNSRTRQQMPLYYQLYEDYMNHKAELDIENAVRNLDIPILICHGTLDSAVPIDKAHALQSWQPNAELLTVESDHVFGRSHPWGDGVLPPAMNEVVDASIRFSKRSLRI